MLSGTCRLLHCQWWFANGSHVRHIGHSEWWKGSGISKHQTRGYRIFPKVSFICILYFVLQYSNKISLICDVLFYCILYCVVLSYITLLRIISCCAQYSKIWNRTPCVLTSGDQLLTIAIRDRRSFLIADPLLMWTRPLYTIILTPNLYRA